MHREFIRNVSYYIHRESKKDDDLTKACLRLATDMVAKFPEAFKITSKKNGKKIDSGVTALKNKLHDCARHRKRTTEGEKKPKPKREGKMPACRISKNIDSMGYVAYEPGLEGAETEETQLTKKEILKKDFEEKKLEKIVLKELLFDTYPSQRVLINNREKEDASLDDVLTKHWPHLRIKCHFFDHASVLLGKDVQKVWYDNITEKGLPIFEYFNIECSSKKDKQGCPKFVSPSMDEIKAAKEAANNLDCQTPKIISIFSVLPHYFGEKPLYKLHVSVICLYLIIWLK